MNKDIDKYINIALKIKTDSAAAYSFTRSVKSKELFDNISYNLFFKKQLPFRLYNEYKGRKLCLKSIKQIINILFKKEKEKEKVFKDFIDLVLKL